MLRPSDMKIFDRRTVAYITVWIVPLPGAAQTGCCQLLKLELTALLKSQSTYLHFVCSSPE